ncbi:MAG TPA: DegT/DnrJ/EryC1/StrS family aminotransferase [Candidatus Hydrogenedentes bacterium]|mgnify:CR=1 FL=1|nr:DegT/DnrJ/EryC1/StrS family aminotransferase [Candidatus Hydrogenedentota bacterium]
MPDARIEAELAINGGPKAVPSFEGKGHPKIAVEEFLSLAGRFGFSKGTLERLRAIVKAEDIGEGPFLGHYYANLRKTCVQAFEERACDVFDARYALGVSSGTGALHSAFVAAGCGPGTEVICSAIGFYATPAAVVQAKAVPVFCDVDESMAMDPAKIESLITPRTVAIAPTHVMGSVCDMRAIMRVARKHKLKVVEDCAQSVGATFRGKSVGTFGDLGCFSISSYKTIGAGEGGLILTRTKRMWERANQFAESGGLWRPERFAPPRYESELFAGTNYRMSELEAAVDVIQLGRLATFVKRFRSSKRRILEQLPTYAEIAPQILNDPDGEVGYQIRFFPESFALGERVAAALQAEGVGAGFRGRHGPPDWHIYSYMYPIILQKSGYGRECVFDCPHYTRRGGKVAYARGDCPVADELFDRVVIIGLNRAFTAGDCRRIAKGITKVLDAYCTRDPKARPWF